MKYTNRCVSVSSLKYSHIVLLTAYEYYTILVHERTSVMRFVRRTDGRTEATHVQTNKRRKERRVCAHDGSVCMHSTALFHTFASFELLFGK